MEIAERDNVLIGQLLIAEGLITSEQLEAGLREQKKTGDFICATLAKLGFAPEEKIFNLLSKRLNIPYVRLRDIPIEPSIIQIIPAKFANHYKVVPVELRNNALVVAMADPLDIRTLDDIRLLLGLEVKGVLTSQLEIQEAIRKYYGIGAETLERIAPDFISEEAKVSLKGTAQIEDIEGMAEDASIIKFVNQIILGGYRDRATDIHIEPYVDDLKVRYRIDGVLHDAAIPATVKQFQAAIISRIKIMSNLNIAERRLPQDGRIKVKVGDEELDLRVSLLPTPFGEGIDIRILSSKMLYSLEGLGLLGDHLKILEDLIKKPHGIIFVTGPTGSGKTTTLYACLSKMNNKELKIITIEDPIEYQLPNITQIQVTPKIGLTFAAGLRSMLRHDPDIMMVGEVRDYETAEITIRSSLTGHLVFSTLHTNDAAGGITRLLDIGIEPYLVASSVECFIAQRLVRLICPNCKTEAPLTKELMRELGVGPQEAKEIKFFEGKGCENCKFTGYKGRTAIYEFLIATGPIKELIIQRASSDKIKKKAVAEGMRSLAQDGWLKIKKGITTPAEVLRVAKETS